MNHRTKMSLIDKIHKVRLESNKFRAACAKSVSRSRALLDTSSSLIDENQEQLEQSMVLKEEIISNKCEALAIMEYAMKEKKFYDIHPVSVSHLEELRMVEEMLAELDKISIPDENSSLQELRKEFLALSFLPGR